MAKIIYEQREFKDNNSGIVTKYDYIAIAGTGEDSHEYEVQLKNLVQSEKMALKMIHNLENKGGTIVTSKAKEGEGPTITKTETSEENWLDELNS